MSLYVNTLVKVLREFDLDENQRKACDAFLNTYKANSMGGYDIGCFMSQVLGLDLWLKVSQKVSQRK